MLRRSSVLLVLALFGTGSAVSLPPIAWPHRAMITALRQRPVAFRAYSLGGDLIVAHDASGRPSASAAGMRPGPLPVRDTIRTETPADFPLDLSKGPVVFVADGGDSLHLVVGRNPNGSVNQVSANGRKLIVRLVANRFVIDSR
jgi:hypothetical protein